MLLAILVASIAVGIRLLPDHAVGFLSFVLAMVVLMLFICSVKGEPPAWR